MNNIVLNFEKLIEGRARHLAREKKYHGKITPASSLSIFVPIKMLLSLNLMILCINCSSSSIHHTVKNF